jgi:hypothetical protein
MALKKAIFYAIAGVALIRLTIWALIGSCTALAPDERGYFEVFRWINNSQEIRPQLHWAGTPEWVLHLFFIPAKLFTWIGVGDFHAFRLQAILIAVIATLFMVLSISKSGLSSRLLELDKKSRTSLLIFLGLALLMPSNLIWTTLGLREPYIYFSLALILLSFSSYMNSRNVFSPWIVIYFIGLGILGFTKFYLMILMLISMIGTLVILAMKRKSIKILIVFLVTVAIIPIFSDKFKEVNWPTFQISAIKLTLDVLPDFSSPQLPSMTFSQLTQCRDSKTAGPLLLTSLNFAEMFLKERVQTSLTQPLVGEPSATALRSDENLREELNLLNLPVGLFSFLLFPLSILDAGIFGLLGVAELTFWIPLYVLLGIRVWRVRRSISMNPLLLACLSFTLIFTAFSALSEVNFGTALRHRSVLLIPLVLTGLAAWSSKPKGDKDGEHGNHHPLS